jgi:quercetin dioxygenase-like cupin family protein
MHDSVYVNSEHRLSHSKDGLLMESLGIGLQNQQMEPFMITLEPGRGGKEPICHPGQEFAYCLSGEVDYQVEANTYHLKAGDSLLLEATREHVFKNNGPKSACFLIVFQAVGDSNVASRLHF